MPKQPRERSGYRWYPFVTAVFVTTLIISNIVAVKLVTIFGLVLPAAVVLFPIAYIFGDVLTEVYGYSNARRVIWTGFFCNLLAVTAIWLAGLLPPASFWTVGPFQTAPESQQAYLAILGFAPRLLGASFVAYLSGEFLNSYVMSRLKVRTEGRFLWLRTISSTVLGEGIDFNHLHHPGILWHLVAARAADDHPGAVGLQGGLRSPGDSTDLRGRPLSQTLRK